MAVSSLWSYCFVPHHRTDPELTNAQPFCLPCIPTSTCALYPHHLVTETVAIYFTLWPSGLYLTKLVPSPLFVLFYNSKKVLTTNSDGSLNSMVELQVFGTFKINLYVL